MPIRFVYFDLGNVLLEFSHPRMISQMAAAAGAPVELVREVVFGGLADRYERGELTTGEFYAEFCEQTQRQPTLAELEHACSDIFWPREDSIALANELRPQVALGILSNTNAAHWTFVQQHFPQALTPFTTRALSYELGSMKPAAAIYRAAAELANVSADEIFFLDDRHENIDAAHEAGWHGEVFTTAAEARKTLQKLGFTV